MDDTTQAESSGNQPLSLMTAFLFYLAGFALFILTCNLVAWLSLPPAIIICVYLAIGVALNHLVLKRIIEWHPMYNTLDNVATAKLATVIFWPISYLLLFFKLAINKFL